MKVCTGCKEEKELQSFGLSKTGRLGRTEKCRACRSKVHKTKYETDQSYKAKHKSASSTWKKANREAVNESAAKWRSENLDKVRDSNRRWASANLAKCAEKVMKRHARKLKAIPALTEADQEFNCLVISEAYELAKLRQQATGVRWEVDHKVPLSSEFVCGLHYFHNIQVITESENRMKSNKYWEGM